MPRACSALTVGPLHITMACHTANCPCEAGPQSLEHVLQSAPLQGSTDTASISPKESCLQKSSGAPRRTWCRQPTSSTPSSYVSEDSPGMLLTKEGGPRVFDRGEVFPFLPIFLTGCHYTGRTNRRGRGWGGQGGWLLTW